MDPTPLKNITVNNSIMPVNVSFEIRKSWDILKLDVMVIIYKVTIILVHIWFFAKYVPRLWECLFGINTISNANS